MHNTPSHASDHLCQIWKESIQNCRCYKADMPCETDGQRGRVKAICHPTKQLHYAEGIIKSDKISLTQGLLNTLRPRQDGPHFPDDSFKWIFLNENAWISIEVSLKFVPKGPINIIPELVQIMAWRRPGDKPLSEPMMVSLLTHICVTQPQWVNTLSPE